MKKQNDPNSFASKVKVVGKTVTISVSAVVLLVFALFNQWTWDILATIAKILAPLVYGLMLAFIINYPYEFCYNKLYKKIGSKREKLLKLRKILSIVTTYVFLGVVVAFLVTIIIPSVVESLIAFKAELPSYMTHFSSAYTHIAGWINNTFGIDLSDTKAIENFAGKFILGNESSLALTSHLLNIALNSIWDFLYGLYNGVIAIIVSVYVISTKEKLLRQTKKLTLAYVPKKFHNFIRDVKNESYNICGKFIIGKIIDSAIIGVLCFIGLKIIRIDYAVLISVVVGITNIIPFFGPFIGAIPCAILLLLVDPWDCLWFIIFIFGLQQLDGNVIGPKILGDQIGISGIWVLVGVTVGGGLFGFAGMVFGVPVCAVIYTLLGKAVNSKLDRKKRLTTDIKAD